MLYVEGEIYLTGKECMALLHEGLQLFVEHCFQRTRLQVWLSLLQGADKWRIQTTVVTKSQVMLGLGGHIIIHKAFLNCQRVTNIAIVIEKKGARPYKLKMKELKV